MYGISDGSGSNPIGKCQRGMRQESKERRLAKRWISEQVKEQWIYKRWIVEHVKERWMAQAMDWRASEGFMEQ